MINFEPITCIKSKPKFDGLCLVGSENPVDFEVVCVRITPIQINTSSQRIVTVDLTSRTEDTHRNEKSNLI